MRMTDKDTPHAPKRMLTSIGLRQNGQGKTLIKDRYHWVHRSLVDVVADCVCAFHVTLFSSPTLDLRPRLTRLHLATVATQ